MSTFYPVLICPDCSSIVIRMLFALLCYAYAEMAPHEKYSKRRCWCSLNAIQQEQYIALTLLSCSSDITVHLQRALGRWVRSSIDKGRRISAEQPASEEPAGRSAAPADSVPARSPFADLPGHESFPGIQPAASSAAAPSNRDQPASASSKGLHVGPRKGSQEEHNASASMQPQKADSGGRRASQPVGQEHHSSAARHSRPSMISSTQSTGGLLVSKVQRDDACMDSGCLTRQRALPGHAATDQVPSWLISCIAQHTSKMLATIINS